MNTPLSDPALPASAKIIWLVLRRNAPAGPLGPGAIEARSGLTRHTVLRGLTKLAAAGWCVVQPDRRAFATVRMADGRAAKPGPGLAERTMEYDCNRLYAPQQEAGRWKPNSTGAVAQQDPDQEVVHMDQRMPNTAVPQAGPADTARPPVGTPIVAIVGAGWMGTQMAQVYATAGLEVCLTDTMPEALPTALDRIRANLAETNPSETAAVLARITVHRELAPAVRGAALVQESVPENLALKQQVFRAVEDLVSPETVLGTNTSSLSVTAIAGACVRPERVIGIHWVSPAYLMPVVEVICADQTSEHTLAWSKALLQACNRTPVVCRKELPGFVLNRLQHVLLNEALFLVDKGYVSKEDVDNMVRWAMAPRLALYGPLRNNDMVVSKKTSHAVGQYIYSTTGDARFRPNPMMEAAVAEGRFGVAQGAGFYDYSSQDIPALLQERDRGIREVLAFLQSRAAK